MPRALRRRKPAPLSTPDRRAVEQLAYRLYEARGRVDGHHVQDWLDAESRLRDNGRGVRLAREVAACQAELKGE
jgi:hypothetical protein